MNTKTRKVAGWATLAIALAVGLGSVASSGAYFTDTADGNITGTVGSIRITTTTNPNLVFSNLLPGELQTKSVTFQNTGTSTQDVWLAFPNATALSALNNLGTYGEFHVAYNGVPVFDSANLNDRAATCGAFAPTGCWPVPAKLKLGTLVAGQSGTLQISFGYAGKLSTQVPEGTTAPFNVYPVAGQTTVVAGQTGAGLPIQIIASQKDVTI